LSPTLRLRGGEDDSDGDEDEEEGGETDGGETNPDYVMERHEFNHVIRVLNTNIDGTRTVRPRGLAPLTEPHVAAPEVSS
jgi:hypothetical protein